MKTVIVDNEENAAFYLKEILGGFPDVTVENVFTDAVQAVLYLTRNECELIFLDIDMPVINGIYIANEVTQVFPNSKICFVTAYQEYAVKAFEMNAIDYILKPYSKERLELTLDKIKKLDRAKDKVLGEIDQKADLQLDMICGYDDEMEEINLLSYHEIFYFEAQGRDIWVHTKNKIYRGNRALNYYEEKLKRSSFFRSHKAFLVNMEKLSKLRPRINYTYDILFHGISDVVPISRNKVKKLKEYLE